MMAGTALVIPTHLTSILNGFLFLELHLIAFEVGNSAAPSAVLPLTFPQIKNQTVGLEEDRAGKPDRPIVSGRITPDAAHILYLTFIAASLLFSAAHGVLAPSLIHLVAIYAYNECGLSTVWWLKSLICAVGYATYFWGIGVLFGGDAPLERSAALAILIEAAIFTTTVSNYFLLSIVSSCHRRVSPGRRTGVSIRVFLLLAHSIFSPPITIRTVPSRTVTNPTSCRATRRTSVTATAMRRSGARRSR